MNAVLAQVVFVLVALWGAFRVLHRPRKVDAFTTAYGAALLYFLPGFFGHARQPTLLSIGVPFPLVPEAYLVFAAVLASIAASAALFDRSSRPAARLWLPGSEHLHVAAALVAAVSLVVAVATSGRALLNPDKDAVLEGMTRWYSLATTATCLLGAILMARVQGTSRRWTVPIAAFVLFDLYVGFRDTAAFLVISFVLLRLGSGRAESLLRTRWRVGVLVLAAVFLLFLYKGVAAALKFGAWDILVENLSSPDLYVAAITHAEPFTTQAVLNEILGTGFRVDPSHLLDAMINFLPFSPEFGIRSLSFNDLFQPILFPEAAFGMASNIWAEMLASGGWPLLIVFIAIFNGVLALGSRLLRSEYPHVRAIAAILCAQWGFYIHRNDLAYELTLLKRTLAVYVVCVLADLVLSALVRARTSSLAQGAR